MLQIPPSREVLARTARATPGGAAAMLSQGAPQRAELIEGKSLTDDQILDLMVQVPNLLKKPVFSDGNLAVLGFSPEQMATLIKQTV